MRRIVGMPDHRQREVTELANRELKLFIERPETGDARMFTVWVATPEALESSRGTGVQSDRAQLVVDTFDWKKIRECLASLVRSCWEPSMREAAPIFSRYFIEQYGTVSPEVSKRHSRTIELRAFDPPWMVGAQDVTLTFGVGERGKRQERELTLQVCTPQGLRARSREGTFVLAHRATIIVQRFDLAEIKKHIAMRVEHDCSAPTLDAAEPLLQRFYRLEWERSLGGERRMHQPHDDDR